MNANAQATKITDAFSPQASSKAIQNKKKQNNKETNMKMQNSNINKKSTATSPKKTDNDPPTNPVTPCKLPFTLAPVDNSQTPTKPINNNNTITDEKPPPTKPTDLTNLTIDIP